MINPPKMVFVFGALSGIAACSSTEINTSASVAPRAVPSTYTMEVTDIDYGSVRTDRRYLMSYSFPDARGRFAVRATSQAGVSEPVSDTSDYAYVNDDVATSVICKDGIRKLNATPDYLVADRAYQSAYICTNSGRLKTARIAVISAGRETLEDRRKSIFKTPQEFRL